MTLADLQAELETLPYHERIARMIALGRAPANAPLIDRMEAGAFDLRWLALQSCEGSRDGARVLRLIGDASRLIRRGAAGLIARIGTNAQVLDALERTLPRQRVRLLLALHRGRRYDVIETCLGSLARRNDAALFVCLPFGAAQTVRDLLPGVQDRFTASQWARLARFHPDIALEVLYTQAAQADRADAGLAYRANSVLPVTSETRPQASLDLMRTLVRHLPLNDVSVAALAPRLPAQVIDLILSTDATPSVPLERVLPRLDEARLVAFVERYDLNLGYFSDWVARLSPALRTRLYTDFGRGWEDKDGCIAPPVVALLPRAVREQEARRHLNLPALAARPAQRLPYAAYLTWDEARQTLDPFVRNPDPDLRVVAHATLAGAVKYHRDRIGELLAMHIARKNEQDPVRLAMLAGLAALPPGIWKPEHLDDLGQILRNALNAADLSEASANAIERLIVYLLPFYPHWCGQWLATLALERGRLTMPSLENRISDDNVQTLAPFLLPVLHGWENREGWYNIVGFAFSLGCRLRVFDALGVMLERMVNILSTPYLSEGALELLADHQPRRFAALVPALIAGDPSWATRPLVYTHLHRKRQDLLTPFLGFRAYKGRFSTGKTRFVLPVADGFVRWTGRQQQIFADVLTDVTVDTGRDTPSVLTVIGQLAALPAVWPARLIELAGLHGKPPAARDAALRALGKLDSGVGVGTLLDALGDDRGRVAIYALRRALLEMPPSRALETLRGVPTEKVTVAKEVIRLLGELKTDAAYTQLLSLDAGDLHRDVRIALLRAFWDFLDRESSWDVLERAAQDADEAIAAHVSRIPATGLSRESQSRLIGILALLCAHPAHKVRLDALNRCGVLPVTDREHRLLPLFLAALGSRVEDERQAASEAAFMTYTGRNAPLVGSAARSLLPDRRALATMVNTLTNKLNGSRAALLPTARAVLDVLVSDPLTTQMQVRLAMQALPTAEMADLLTRMAASRALHADALQTAMQSLPFLALSRKDVSLAELESVLALSDDRYLRRLALAALVAQANGPIGWTDDRLARLAAYRRDPAALVAEAAQFTFPAKEEEALPLQA